MQDYRANHSIQFLLYQKSINSQYLVSQIVKQIIGAGAISGLDLTTCNGSPIKRVNPILNNAFALDHFETIQSQE